MLASASADHTIKLWDMKTFTEITTLRGHDNIVNSVSFHISGKVLASGSNDRTVKIWNLETLK